MQIPVKKAITVALAAAGFVACGFGAWSWSQKPPVEVRTLESVLRRLSRGNDLGSQPIAFMVASGSYTAQLAEQRGLCKPDQCQMFAQLNPYQHYGNGWDELIRQGYNLGDIEGWAASSGTVVIPPVPPSAPTGPITVIWPARWLTRLRISGAITSLSRAITSITISKASQRSKRTLES